MKTEFITLNEERQVTLTAYLQETGGAFPYFEKTGNFNLAWRRLSVLFRQGSRPGCHALFKGRVSGVYSPLFCKLPQRMAKSIK